MRHRVEKTICSHMLVRDVLAFFSWPNKIIDFFATATWFAQLGLHIILIYLVQFSDFFKSNFPFLTRT